METTNSVIVPYKNTEGCHLSGNDSYTLFDGFWQKKRKPYQGNSTHLYPSVIK